MRKAISLFILLIFFIGSMSFLIPVSDNTSFYKAKDVVISINDTETIDTYAMSAESPSVKILYPLSTFPAIVEKGDTLSLKVNSSYFPQEWEILLTTAYDIVWEIVSLKILNIAYNSTSFFWNILVEIPLDIDEELYNVTVRIKTTQGNFETTEPRAVCIKTITDTFSFVHLTDLHIGDPRGMRVDIQQTIGWKAAKKCISEINLLGPDFVVITGDLLFGQLYPLEYSLEYKKCYQILQLFNVPTFVCPGNHDGYIQFGQDGFKLWQNFFGPLYYSFNYGDSHFTIVNSYDWPAKSRLAFSFVVFNWGGCIGEEQMEWIEKDLHRSTSADLSLMFLHHNPLWDTQNDSLLKNGYKGREELLLLINTYGIDAVFAGHVHHDDVTVENDILYITTTTAASDLSTDDSYWGYRMVTIEDGDIKSYNYREPKHSLPSYRLNYTYTPNDGSVETVSVEIENDLEMNIEATVYFYVPHGAYEVENGEIFMERSGEKIKKVYVRTKIDALSIKTVSIYPT